MYFHKKFKLSAPELKAVWSTDNLSGIVGGGV